MRYVQFGRTGIRVSPLCLGTMNFGRVAGDGSLVADEPSSIRVMHRAIDAGINFFDTANMYTRGVSETIVGNALADGKREKIVLATKSFHKMGDGPNDWGSSRRHIMMQVEGSLRRLRTDWIDLYQMHRPDPSTPVDETLRALDDLVHQGQGAVYREQHVPRVETRRIVLARGDPRHGEVCLRAAAIFDFRPGNRARGAPLLPRVRDRRDAVEPRGARVAHRSLPRRSPGRGDGDAHGRESEMARFARGKNRFAIVQKLAPIAAEKGCSLSQFAVAWTLANPAVTSPIIGPRTIEQLDDALGALDVTVTPEDLRRVDEIVAPGTMVPGDCPEMNAWDYWYRSVPDPGYIAAK